MKKRIVAVIALYGIIGAFGVAPAQAATLNNYWCKGLNDLQCVLFESGHPRIP